MEGYRKLIERLEEQDISIYRALCAYEVEALLEEYIGEDDDQLFDVVCDFVYDWYINSDASANDVVRWISEAIENGELLIKDFLDYDKWDEITDFLNEDYVD